MTVEHIFIILGITIGSLLALFLIFQIIARILRKIIHFPAPAFIGRFLDSDHRRRMQPPQAIIERSGIEEAMTVLEIGCGSGAFTTFVARAVGRDGLVYALDIQPGMLEQLKNKLGRPQFEDIRNISMVCASAYELPFPDRTMDIVYMVSVFQEIPDKARALAEIRRVLKKDGSLAISEFFIDPDYPLRKTTMKQGIEGGFFLIGVFGSFWNYTVRFKNKVADVKVATSSIV